MHNSACSHRLFWAKSEGSNGRTHPLLCHMIDTASVVEAMWASAINRTMKTRCGSLFNTGDGKTSRIVSFLAGLHDIGKASPAFQCKHEAIRQQLVASGLTFPAIAKPVGHGTLTAVLVPQLIDHHSDQHAIESVAHMLGAHHGHFPRSQDIRNARHCIGGKSWSDARAQLFAEYSALYCLEGLTVTADALSNEILVTLAGLVSVADWIASSEEHFEHVDSIDCRMKYQASSRKRAEEVLGDLFWAGGTTSAEALSFRDLFPHIARLRPLQKHAVEIAGTTHGPTVVVIEAPMGEGKTEAAMYLAARQAQQSDGGFYFALPSQATTDQMFSRVSEFLTRHIESKAINLALLHGHASLSAEFRVLIERGRALLSPSDIYNDGEQQDADIVAGEWFTYRKRGLLSPFGVGTIDQALLSILQTRHFFVRLFGLSQKTVIIDEVHAYDAYMSTLLERLLEWLGAMGCSVVLLSATLPTSRRKALLHAYGRGLGADQATLPQCSYPRISWLSESGSDANHVPASASASRMLGIEWMAGQVGRENAGSESLCHRLMHLLAEGGCAAVVCNTVARAQDVYSSLRRVFPGTCEDDGPEVDLLHSRFLHKDRRVRQDRALRRFGKDDSSRPRRAILVSTQIIEQSLDLDFDVIVSDLAPVDLLLQRSGRMHRHERHRPPRLKLPVMLIRSPDRILDGGVPEFPRADRHVYDAHILLRTYLALHGRTQLRIPEDVEDLVEHVYANLGPDSELSTSVQDYWIATRGGLESAVYEESDQAERRGIRQPHFAGPLYRLSEDSRQEDDSTLHVEFQALTRLAPPNVQVIALPSEIAAEHVERSLDATEVRFLLDHALNVSNRQLVSKLLSIGERPASWRRSPLLRNSRLVRLDQDNTGLDGEMRFDATLGLVHIRKEQQ